MGRIKWGNVLIVFILFFSLLSLISGLVWLGFKGVKNYKENQLKKPITATIVFKVVEEETNGEQESNMADISVSSTDNNNDNNYNKNFLGTFYLTAYCPCDLCSEGYGHSTATGAYATEGITVAADPSVLPYGTHIIIDGHEYIVQDCGGGVNGNHIDIFVEDHNSTFLDCYNGYRDIYLKGE